MSGSSAENLIAASPYLSLLRSKTQLACDLTESEVLERLDAICEQVSDWPIEDQADTEQADVEQALINYKTDFAFLWCLAELQSFATQSRLGQLQTRFAEVTIDLALRSAWLSTASKHKSIQQKIIESQGRVQACLYLVWASSVAEI